MSSSSFFFFFATFSIGLVLLVVIVSWTIKTLIAREMNLKFEEFRKNLKAETEKTLTDFNRQVQLQKAQGVPERNEKVAHLYAYLMDLVKAGKGFPALRSTEELVPRARKIADYGQDFIEFYQKNGLYLSDAFCLYLDRHLDVLEAACARFAKEAPKAPTEAQERAQIEEIRDHWKRLEDFIPGVVIELKKEYYRIGAGDLKTPRW